MKRFFLVWVISQWSLRVTNEMTQSVLKVGVHDTNTRKGHTEKGWVKVIILVADHHVEQKDLGYWNNRLMSIQAEPLLLSLIIISVAINSSPFFVSPPIIHLHPAVRFIFLLHDFGCTHSSLEGLSVCNPWSS